MPAVERSSLLRCPTCGYAEALAMPADACLFFHECAGCHVLLRPRAGDCCVFCSYGSVPCPPVQAGATCADAADSTGAAAAAGCCAATRPAESGARGTAAARALA